MYVKFDLELIPIRNFSRNRISLVHRSADLHPGRVVSVIRVLKPHWALYEKSWLSLCRAKRVALLDNNVPKDGIWHT